LKKFYVLQKRAGNLTAAQAASSGLMCKSSASRFEAEYEENGSNVGASTSAAISADNSSISNVGASTSAATL
ncbi:unnamed protein product, partial [Tilletia controversa]